MWRILGFTLYAWGIIIAILGIVGSSILTSVFGGFLIGTGSCFLGVERGDE